MRKFVKTRAAPAPPPAPLPAPPPAPTAAPPPADKGTHLNGHANGGARCEDFHSTLSSRSAGGSAGGQGGAGGPLWEDEEFPPQRALGTHRGKVRWMRPYELSSRPTFRGEGCTNDDDDDDEDTPETDEQIADRWCAVSGRWLGAGVWCAALALAATPRLLARAVPAQGFRRHYRGRFTFRLWVCGEWRAVYVDDRLPLAADGARWRPLFARARDPHDYTLPLLEKAFAKLYGSYAALSRGPAQPLQELSGAIVQALSPWRQARAVRGALRAALPRATLVLAASADRRRAALVTAARGHSLRLAGTPPAAPGTCQRYWMSLEEVAEWFSEVQLAHVGPAEWALEPALAARAPWRAVLARRRWLPAVSAGGPAAAANPQFALALGAPGALLVAAVAQRPRPGARLRSVGLALYQLPPGARPARPLRDLRPLRALEACECSRAREVAAFLSLPAGEYLLVPHTRRAGQRASFLLRLFADRAAHVWELNEDNIIIRDIAQDYMEDASLLPPKVRATIDKLLATVDCEEEVEGGALARLVRRVWGGGWGGPPALAELARALRPLAEGGRLRALLARVWCWRAAAQPLLVRRACRPPALPAHRLRDALAHAGLTASNKVVEGVVSVWATRGWLPPAGIVAALARLHLAHERYRALESKMKSNPLSLEEMILMTIYS